MADIDKEVWKTIENFDDYDISNKGKLRSRRNGNNTKIINCSQDKNGYYRTQIINNNDNYKWKYIHRLVAEEFIHNPENKPCVNHIDCDTSNNDISNLEWCTRAENNKHAMKNGLTNIDGLKNNFGENHHQSKLTEKDVLEIRKRYKEEDITQKELSKDYPVSYEAVNGIINRKSWSHI